MLHQEHARVLFPQTLWLLLLVFVVVFLCGSICLLFPSTIIHPHKFRSISAKDRFNGRTYLMHFHEYIQNMTIILSPIYWDLSMFCCLFVFFFSELLFLYFCLGIILIQNTLQHRTEALCIRMPWIIFFYFTNRVHKYPGVGLHLCWNLFIEELRMSFGWKKKKNNNKQHWSIRNTSGQGHKDLNIYV